MRTLLDIAQLAIVNLCATSILKSHPIECARIKLLASTLDNVSEITPVIISDLLGLIKPYAEGGVAPLSWALSITEKGLDDVRSISKQEEKSGCAEARKVLRALLSVAEEF